jgi:hypothetical protein
MAGFFKKLFKQITNQAEVDWDELEANLIAADLGAKLSTGIVDELYDLGREVTADDVVEVTRKRLSKILPEDAPAPAPRADGKPTVILVVGVNGTGKTTSSAKLGMWLKHRGHSVIMAAADTEVRRALALTFPFGAILLGSNYLVDPRYYLTPAALLLLFIVPDRRDFLRLAAWWAFIALIHNPFILTGYSLW